MKRLVSHITIFAMIMTLFAGIGPVSAVESGTLTGQAIEYIEFGSYPQTEIVGEASQSGAYGKPWEQDGDYEVNSELYTQLQEEDGWNSNDKTIAGVKYHRIKSGDSTCVEKLDSRYYWSDSTTYHYFRYDSIKWRVLEIDGDDAFLLSETALDVNTYNYENISITWEKSTVRGWLNGYFMDCAFKEEEQTAILDTVFLPSESEVCGNYGFAGDPNTFDKARQLKSSTYAKAMGLYSYTNSGYSGNCIWWLRSPDGSSKKSAAVSYSGYVNSSGYDVCSYYALRPALRLNLKSNNLYTIKYRDVEVTADDVKLSERYFDYDGTAKTPDVEVSGLTKDKDYTVSYEKNINPGKARVVINGIGSYSGTITKEFSIYLPNLASPGKLSRDISYDLIEFGSYPQTEIVYEEDASLYSALQAAVYSSNDDTEIEGVKYHRISTDEAEYRYFRYEPIKWRVLYTDGSYAFLLADIALDGLSYNQSASDITWEESTVRDWLNGYFIDCAFTAKEQDEILNTYISNDDSRQYGTYGGNGTLDRVFLLSESEVYGYNAVKYYFSMEYKTEDKGRRATCSPYAKAMGVELNSSENICWWLRSPGRFSDSAVYVNFGGDVDCSGSNASGSTYGIRPALYLSFNDPNLYREAGSTGAAAVQTISSVNMDSEAYPLNGDEVTPKVFIEDLTEGVDYTVSYENNDKIGVATAVIEGIGEWSGTIKKYFAIVEKADISSMNIDIPDGDIKYDGSPSCPAIKVDYLVQDKDYIVTYENNNGAGTGKVIVTGIEENGYTGTIEKTFKISKGDISKRTINIADSPYTYSGEKIEPEVTIAGLVQGTDFTVSYADNVNAGTATVTATGTGNWEGTLTGEFTISPASIENMNAKVSEVTYTGKAAAPAVTVEGLESTDFDISCDDINAGTGTVKITGKGNYTGEITKSFLINAASIAGKKATLKTTKYTYTGKAKKPAVAVSGLNSSDFKATYISNVKCGKAKVAITGTGNYKGSITKYFYITPAKAAISKAAAGKKKITVTIKSQKTSGVSGYEIYYKKAGSSAKSVTTTGTSKVLTGLVKGKKYTVKVRAYKTIDGKKYYGDYSVAKTVKVK